MESPGSRWYFSHAEHKESEYGLKRRKNWRQETRLIQNCLALTYHTLFSSSWAKAIYSMVTFATMTHSKMSRLTAEVVEAARIWYGYRVSTFQWKTLISCYVVCINVDLPLSLASQSQSAPPGVALTLRNISPSPNKNSRHIRMNGNG